MALTDTSALTDAVNDTVALSETVRFQPYERKWHGGLLSLFGRFGKAWRVVLKTWRVLLIAVLLLPWLERNPAEAKLSVEDYAVLGEALHAAEMDEWPRAFRLMELIDDPLAIKLLKWVTLVEDKSDADFDTLSTFIIENPDWPRIDEIQELAEARLTDSANQDLTAALFRVREPLSTRGDIRFAEALMARGLTIEAAQHLRHAWIFGNFSAKEEKAFLNRHGRHLRPSEHSSRLEQLLWNREWRSARRMLERVPNSDVKLGKARLALQTQSPGVDRAVAAVPSELINDPGLMFDRARWRRLKRKFSGAKELLMNPPDRLVRPARWWFERSFHIRQSIDDREFEEAYQLASRHGQQVGSDYAEAEWLAGWLALRFVDRPEEALRHFVRLYDRVKPPVLQARAAYWAGRAASALNDTAGAVAWYQRGARHSSSYYGQLARAELGNDAGLTPSPKPTDSERAAFGAKELAVVARMLIAAGDRRYLKDFLDELAERAETPVEIGMITEYANAAGLPTLLARIGRSAAYDGKVYDKAAFPIPRIEGLLTPTANVEPALLFGLARQESMFQSAVTSSAGARGLMQMIPSTARIVAKRANTPFDRERLTADFDYNARLGGHYLETLIKRFDGSVPLALAGYNAGPVRVKRWIKRHGDPRSGDRYDLVDWIELIPFDETRNYVQRVLEGYNVYKRRFAQPNIEMIDFPGINLLHPPPKPAARPADFAKDVGAVQSKTTKLAASHRPRLKPLDDLPDAATPLARPSFDDDRSRNVAVDQVDEGPKL